MLTPPGGNLGSTLCVLVAAALVFAAPVFAALVAPDLVFAAPCEEAAAVPLAAAVLAAVFAAPPVFAGCDFPVSAAEVSDSKETTRQSDAQQSNSMVRTGTRIRPPVYSSLHVLD